MRSPSTETPVRPPVDGVPGKVPDAPANLARRAALAVAGLVLVAAGAVLPLWRAHLVAPQYPAGLDLVAYGSRVTGDVTEIDMLNHYVGMRPFDPAAVPEMQLWPFAVAGALAAALAAALVRKPALRHAALAYLWSLPFGVLAAIQLRLYQYGHDLDPGAALRIPEFTPWVVGPTRIWNFTTWSYPGVGLMLLAVAAALLTFGPRVLRRLASRLVATAAALAGLLLVGTGVLPAAASQADHHHPAPGHDSGTEHQPAVGHQPSASHHSGTTGPSRTARGPFADQIATAAPGDTVLLEPGTYAGNVVIETPVRLVGRGHALIQGDGTGTVITVRAAGTELIGLHVRGSGAGPVGDPAAIRVEADEVRIEDAVITDAYMGIAVHGAARTRIEANTISGRAAAVIADDGHALDHEEHAAGPTAGASRGDGVWLWDVDGALVRGNHIHDMRDGVYLSHGSGVLVDRNHISGSRYGVHTMFARDLTAAENTFERNLSGIVLMYGGPALLLRNMVTDNHSPSTGFGILLKDVDGVEAVENVVAANRVGLHLDGPTGTEHAARLRANTVARNGVGIALFPSARARLSANSFVENTAQVLPQGGVAERVEWSEQGWGNYWSTYRGYEGGIPGRGAVPHTEGGRVDTLLGRAPVLAALASSPGVRLLRAVEERWGLHKPAVTDHHPLMAPHSPALPTGVTATSGLVRWVGAALVAAAALFLAAFRRAAVSERARYVI